MAAMQLEQIARRLEDIEAIKQLKAKYIRLVDAKEWDAWGMLFTEDCHLHTEAGPFDGRQNVIAAISRALAKAETVHRIHNPEITITGPDTASAIWPMADFVTGTFNGTPLIIRGYGHYHEDYVRTADGWRVKRSELVRQRVDMSSPPSESPDPGGEGR
jgi:hypothetical protein